MDDPNDFFNMVDDHLEKVCFHSGLNRGPQDY
jgi:hypothetical protein